MSPRRRRTLALAAASALAALSPACSGWAGPTALQPLAERSFVHCPWPGQAGAARARIADAAEDLALAAARGLPVDAPRARLVLAELGTQPSGGHRIELAAEGLKVQQQRLVLTAVHRAPPAEAMVTQALTTPCLALVLPAAGWTQVELQLLREPAR